MHHIDGIDRDQITMFPEALDDYIHEDNPVRFIDGFVGSLDLSSLGFQRVTTADTGRPPYHPGDLLRLLSQPRPLKPQAGEGDQPQCGIDVASAPPNA